jgi:hypothetical protein
VQRLKHMLLYSCKKASELIDKKSFIRLSVKEKVMLLIHTSICDGCKQYNQQSKIIDNILKGHLQNSNPEQVPKFINPELKTKIFSRLNNQ